MQIQQKFHLSEDKVKRLIKHAGKGTTPKQQEGGNILAGDFDPNQVRRKIICINVWFFTDLI